MSWNSFGRVLRVMTWGESHGPAIGAVIDGCPPGIPLDEADIQPFLNKRRPGQNRNMTQRKEPDRVRIMSGTFCGETTGAAISLIIENIDQRSKDYDDITDSFRPGHADYTYWMKYGRRDPRGGGRSSARETAMRVAAGAIARKIIAPVSITGWLHEMGGDAIAASHEDPTKLGRAQINNNAFFSPDAQAAQRWEAKLDQIRKAGDSLGGVVACIAEGVPAGWGAPLYAKLDSELASAMMSINAAKGVEIGDGFSAARLKGSENADEMRLYCPDHDEENKPYINNAAPEVAGKKIEFLSNHAGGILGGIASGQPILCKVAFKPTSSILLPKRSVNSAGEEVDIRTKGRHDPCVAIRAVPVVEAMMALVLADQKLLHHAQTGW